MKGQGGCQVQGLVRTSELDEGAKRDLVITRLKAIRVRAV